MKMKSCMFVGLCAMRCLRIWFCVLIFMIPLSAEAVVFNNNVFTDIMTENEQEITSGNYTYVLQADGTAAITEYREPFVPRSDAQNGIRYSVDEYGNRFVLYLPEELDGHLVSTVRSGAFVNVNNNLCQVDLVIPNTMVDIAPHAFSGSMVHRFVVSPSHPKYAVKGDGLVEKNTMRLVHYAYREVLENKAQMLTVPDGIRIIGPCVFAGVEAKEIILPQSLERIEDEAFYMARDMKKIHIPENVTSIGEAAFGECTMLEEVDLPSNLVEIGNNAFYCCWSLQHITLPDSIKNLNAGAFAYCVSLQQVEVPNAIERLGTGAFFDCWALESIKLPDTLKHIGPLAFSGCNSLKNIDLPNGLQTIGADALSGCLSLTEIALPDSLTEIDALPAGAENLVSQRAFLVGCGNLQSITVSPEHSVFAVVNGALIRKKDGLLINFPPASKETSFIVPECVLTIGADAFLNNQNLKSIVISEGVTTIEKGAFAKCRALQELTLPLSLTSKLIDQRLSGNTYKTSSDIIQDCQQLNTIYITAGLSDSEYQEHEEEVLRMLDEAYTVLTEEGAARHLSYAVIPYAITEERYQSFASKMAKSTQKKVLSNYNKISLASLEKMNQADRNALILRYPTVKEQGLYILKNNTSMSNKEKLSGYFADAGYSQTDYEQDLENINPSYVCYIEVGEGEKQCQYFAGEHPYLLHPCVSLVNAKRVPVVMETAAADEKSLDRYGLPLFKVYFRTDE
ncbi:MAG: leucine-rich repeat domain-containing protein [Clostridiales bacterium]|nr:leucine-rich repeat domain-containing protein [Clostridiales bacterium]